MAIDYSEVLLGQWRDSPRLRALVTDVLQDFADEALAAVARITLMLDIDDSEGVWLDYLGVRLGIRRPATVNPGIDRRFGFDRSGLPFDRAPFASTDPEATVYPLPNEVWRRFLRARAVTVLADGTFPPLRRAIRFIDSNAQVVDNRDMTVTVLTAEPELVRLADEIKALPRTAGVSMIYA